MHVNSCIRAVRRDRWSAAGPASNRVGTEASAFVRRRFDDGGLRIVPLTTDGTRCPRSSLTIAASTSSGDVTLDLN